MAHSKPAGAGCEAMTVTAFVEEIWLPGCEKELPPATMQNYRGVSHRHLLPHLGKIQLGEVQPSHATALLAKLRDQGVRHRTIRYVKQIGSAIFSTAKSQYNLPGENPFKEGKLPRGKDKKPLKPCTSAEQVKKRLQVLPTQARAPVRCPACPTSLVAIGDQGSRMGRL